MPVSKSFTLIEVLVTTSIVLILTILVFPDFRTANSSFALQRSAYKLVQDLRRVEEMSMSAKSTPSSFGSELFPQGGYGVYLQEATGTYSIFADCNNNISMDESGFAFSCKQATEINPFPEKMEQILMERSITVKSIYNSGVERPSINLVFFPPDPIVKVYPLPPPGSNGIIEITLTSGSSNKTILINSTGLIEVKN
jgi:type II secretory pathway pseudopilin PulG